MSNTAFKNWYSRNKDSINKARRSRYQTDPEYREQTKAASKEAYRSNPGPSKAGLSKMKSVNGRVVLTRSISEAASDIGKSPQTIRLWESHGWIPAPTVEAGKRFYTINQVQLLSELSAVLDSMRGGPHADRDGLRKKVVESIKSRWFII